MPDVLQLPDCTVDLRRQEVTRGDQAKSLTRTESQLLAYLAERAGTAVPRSELLTEVWDYHPNSRTHTVAVTVRRLRVKIERDPSRPRALKTVRGIGWMLELLGDEPGEERRGPARTNLRVEPDRFFGRRRELDGLLEPPARLITMHGPPGIGKTRLARELARAWVASGTFDQVWFCDLAACRDGAAVSRAVAGVLDVALPEHDEAAHLGRVLALRGRVVLVLDNFEQVTGAAPSILPTWLTTAPACQLLVTSRQRLRLRGEHTFEVLPLDHPDARALFIDRAEGVLGAFTPDDALVDEILEALDRVPLALELAAARMNVFDLATLRDRLADRLGVLTGGPRDAPERHSTLRAALDWSWQLLDDTQRAAMAQCSVFVDGFTLEAAEAVVEAGAPTAELVSALLDASLIRRPEDEDELRLDMYPVIGQYAAEHLTHDSGPVLRHAHHYATFGAPEALDALQTDPNPAQRRRARLELANLAAATERAIDLGEPELAARCALGSLAATRFNGPHGPSASLADRVCEAGVADPTRLALAVATARARLLSDDHARASAVVDEALPLARALGDEGAQALLLAMRGHLDGPALGRAHVEAALRLAVAASERDVERLALSTLGLWAQRRGDPAARDLHRRELAVCGETGNRRGTAWGLTALGSWYRTLGRMRTSARLMRAAIDVAETIDERHVQARATLGLFDPLRAVDRARARAVANEAIALGRLAGEPATVAAAQANLGIQCMEDGDLAQARRHLSMGAETARTIGRVALQGSALAALGETLSRDGDQAGGEALLRRGVALLRDSGKLSDLATALCRQGEVARRAGALADAASALGEARDLARQVGAGSRSELGLAIARLHEALAATGGS